MHHQLYVYHNTEMLAKAISANFNNRSFSHNHPYISIQWLMPCVNVIISNPGYVVWIISDSSVRDARPNHLVATRRRQITLRSLERIILWTGLNAHAQNVTCWCVRLQDSLNYYGAPLVTKFNKILASQQDQIAHAEYSGKKKSDCACAKHSVFQIL